MSSIIKSKYGPDKVAFQILVVIIIGAAIPGTYKTKFSEWIIKYFPKPAIRLRFLSMQRYYTKHKKNIEKI